MLPESFDISSTDFEAIALQIFRYQSENNPIYKRYLQSLRVETKEVKSITKIPFLPIDFFKAHQIYAESTEAEIIFESSGTSQQRNLSRHYVAKTSLYEKSFIHGFENAYGRSQDYVILALLPSYLERSTSSLVYMVSHLMRLSAQPENGFYLNNLSDLYQTLLKLQSEGKKVLLMGVSFALLDFVEQFPISFPELIVMETGGMKGRRKELIREELHAILCNGFGVRTIHSEYGMTELLSQGYSKGEGLFYPSSTLKILVRDTLDPFSLQPYGATGAINVIDLCNVHSCSFIATQDIGKVYENGSFEILGRHDHSDVRGCNLMVSL